MDQQLQTEAAQLYAQMCKGLSNPHRIMIVFLLAERPFSVNELSELTSLAQPTVSRHLKIMRDKGIVADKRDGQHVYYTISDDRIVQALNLFREVMAERLQRQTTLTASVSQTTQSLVKES